MRIDRSYLGTALLTAVIAAPAWGAVINVPADHPSIQAAIDAAGAGDEVLVAPGTYVGPLDLRGKGITLRSTGGPERTTIDGGGVTGSTIRCATGEGAATVIEGFTVAGGAGTQVRGAFLGGGLFIGDGSGPQVVSCRFADNTADSGGAAYCSAGSSARFLACTFVNNLAIVDGGGVTLVGSSATLEECLIELNEAGIGGGLSHRSGDTAMVSDCLIQDNTAGSDGGAIWSLDSSPVYLRGRIAGNVAFDHGGAMHASGAGSIEILGTVCATNVAFIDGGGLHLAAPATLANCVLVGNGAFGRGGGLYAAAASTALSGCTLTGNAASAGGGVFVDGAAAVELSNTIAWGDIPDALDGGGGVTAVVSDVAGGAPGRGNIDADPLFVDPIGPDGLASTGDEDLRLDAASPCIGAGDRWLTAVDTHDMDDDGSECELLPHDAGGAPRHGGCVEIGAYELAGSATQVPRGDLDASGAVDVTDLLMLLAAWGECGSCCLADIDGSTEVEIVDLLELLVAFGGCS